VVEALVLVGFASVQVTVQFPFAERELGARPLATLLLALPPPSPRFVSEAPPQTFEQSAPLAVPRTGLVRALVAATLAPTAELAVLEANPQAGPHTELDSSCTVQILEAAHEALPTALPHIAVRVVAVRIAVCTWPHMSEPALVVHDCLGIEAH